MKVEQRTWHRWVAVALGPFLLLIAATGVALQAELWITGRSPPGHPAPPNPRQDAPAPARIAGDIGAALQAVRSRYPEAGVRRIDARVTNGRLIVAVNLERGPVDRARFAVQDGRVGAIGAEPRDWHYLILDLHAGFFAGQVGRVVSALCGLALLALAVTGANVFWALYKRRRKAGRRDPFWR